MKKRLLALSLVFIFVMTALIGCGSKAAASPTTLTEFIEQTRTMTTGVSNVTFSLNSTEKMLSDLTATVGEEYKQIITDFMQAEYQIQSTTESAYPMLTNLKFSMKKSGESQAVPITTLLMKDDTYYVNMVEFREFFNSFSNPVFGMFGGMFTTKEDYLAFTLDDINKLAGLTGENAVAFPDMESYTKTIDTSTAFGILISTDFEKALKDITPAPISNENGKIVVNINTANYEAVVNKVCETIIANKEIYMDQYVPILESNEFSKEIVDDLKTNKQEYLDEIQKSCEEMIKIVKENKLKDTDGLQFKMEMGLDGSEGNREMTYDMDFYVKEDENTFGFVMKSNMKEKIADSERVTVPEKTTSLEEFMKSLGQSLGQ